MWEKIAIFNWQFGNYSFMYGLSQQSGDRLVSVKSITRSWAGWFEASDWRTISNVVWYKKRFFLFIGSLDWTQPYSEVLYKFPYPRKQTRGNEFIPCSNNIYDILNRFRSFRIPAITLIWPKSPYKHSVTRSYRSGKESGRRSESPLWRHQWRFFVFISQADDVKREIRLHISRLLTNQKRESARGMG